jgi:hypothetical protein
MRGFASESPTSDEKLIDLGCKKEHLGAFCGGLAHGHNEPEHCIENGVCKSGLRCAVFDFFAKFQDSFDVEFCRALGCFVLHIKHFCTKNWEDFEPPALSKEEQKVRLFGLDAAHAC